MIEKDKKILNKSENIEKDIKKTSKLTKSLNKTYIILVSIILTIFIILFFFRKEIFFNILKINQTEEKNEQITLLEDLKTDKEFYTKTFQKLSENIKILEREINFSNENIDNLKLKILQMEKQLSDINISPQRTELIKIAINIDFEISNGLNYSNNLSLFKTLSNENVFLIEKITILEQYKNSYPNQKIISENFSFELENFIKQHNILKTNDSKTSKFLSNFIIVRKIDNIEENTSDFFILNLENAMKVKNYTLSLEILKNNSEYAKFFPKTIENINVNVLLNNTINEIINYLINNN